MIIPGCFKFFQTVIYSWHEYKMECGKVYFTSSIKKSVVFQEIEKVSEALCDHFSHISVESLYSLVMYGTTL